MNQDVADLTQLIYQKCIGLSLPICKHSEELYPDSIVKLLKLQSAGQFPIYGEEFDKACETLMVEWVKENVSDRQSYFDKLIKTIASEKCVEALCARLQAESIKARAEPTIVSTKNGPIVIHQKYTDNSVKSKIQMLLRTHNIPVLSPVELDVIFSRLNRTMNWEQIILTWIACVIIKIQLKSSDSSTELKVKLSLPSPNYNSIT